MASNYTLGRGRVFFDKFTDNDLRTLGGQRYLGNTPSFNYAVESEDLDHMSSDEGINVIDDSVLLSVGISGEVSWDDISKENLALFFLGSVSTISETATPVVAEDLNYGIAVLGDRYYQIGATAANPAGVRDVGSVALKDEATGTVTYVLDTDYTLDAANARIYIIEGGAADGVAVTVDYTPAAKDRARIISGRESIYGALTFISNNPKGHNYNYFMPYVKLSPSGDFSLKGDDWLSGSFGLKIMEPSYGNPAIYCDGVPYTP